MIAGLAVAIALAVSTASASVSVALNTPFPDQGEPIAGEAFKEDLVAAGHQNGLLDTDMLIEIETNPGCLLEEEAAEAWLLLEAHALRDGVAFTAAWCYRDMKTQRRTYRRNCPLLVPDPPTTEVPGDGSNAAASGAAELDQGSEEIGKRVCRVPTARPGNSNHGWGRAIDITANDALLDCESYAYLWLVDNAGRYGWVHPEWAACGAEKEEAWHWEWGGTDNSGPSLSRSGQFAA